MKSLIISKKSIQAAADKSTRVSAKLEGREIPSGYQRSNAIAQYVAKAPLKK